MKLSSILLVSTKNGVVKTTMSIIARLVREKRSFVTRTTDSVFGGAHADGGSDKEESIHMRRGKGEQMLKKFIEKNCISDRLQDGKKSVDKRIDMASMYHLIAIFLTTKKDIL